MSKLRSVNTHFWSDTFIIDLDPIEKLVFLYLLTNEQTNMLGIYELHIRRIAFDTGIDKDMLIKIFKRLEEAGKAKYMQGYVILPNFIKHQNFNPKMQVSAIRTWNELPISVRKDTLCIPILKGIKAFDKASEPIAEYELEYEYELEKESESKKPAKPDERDQVSDKKAVRKKFTPPKVAEVAEYCKQRRNGIDPEAFVAHYKSKGWKVGNQAMKDWRAAVITWEKRRKSEQQQQPKDNYHIFDGGTF